MRSKIKVFLLMFMTVILCSVGAKAESYFRDINITDAQGNVKDYYYIGESFDITADFYSKDIQDYEADIMIALYDIDGTLKEVKASETIQYADYIQATADFILLEEKEMYVKCYAWKNNAMLPLSSMSGYYINGRERRGDVCIYYKELESITGSTITAFTENSYWATEYKLSPVCELFINGQFSNVGTSMLTEYYFNGNVNAVLDDIILTDYNDDGLYDRIDARIGFNAITDLAVDNSIYFLETYSNEIGLSMLVNKGVECTVLLAGEEINLTDIKYGDVLTIYYNMNSEFDDSSFYEIHVSRKKVTGTVTGRDSQSRYVYVDNVKYLLSPGLENFGFYPAVGYEFDIFLDSENKALYYSEVYGTEQVSLAIIDNVYTANGDQYYATIITPQGDKETHLIKDRAQYEQYRSYVFDDSYYDSYTKMSIESRVYSYEVSDKNYITFEACYAPSGGEGLEYKESKSAIGAIKLSAENTDVLDCSEYAIERLVYPIQIANLEDESEYDAYGFNKLADGTYSFVIITAGTSGALTYKTEFVIFSEYRDNGSSSEIVVYEPNKGETVYSLDGEWVAIEGLSKGTPIVLGKHILGYITAIRPLFNFDLSLGYKNLAETVREGIYSEDLSKVLNIDNLDMCMTFTTSQHESGWVFGLVYAKEDGSICIGDTFTSYTDDSNYTWKYLSYNSNIKQYDVSPDVKVLMYDYGNKYRLSVSDFSQIRAVPDVESAYYLDYFNWGAPVLVDRENAIYGTQTFVLCKMIDEEIVEIYAITPSKTAN